MLMAAFFPSKLNVEKFRRAVCEKKAFQVQVTVCGLITPETFSSGPRFSTEALDQPSRCSVLLRRWMSSQTITWKFLNNAN